ncbi:hypothetical protein [Lysinibacillus xylanilyticus]|uniref:hypothetical protein n=1 Tax=Lysinibacillus xylanilyticus TaxID=582475 RepID=UPI003CFFA597
METERLLGVHWTPPGSSVLTSAANVLSVRKRSVSNKCFICAKAKRQRQRAQSERKSTSHFAKESTTLKEYKLFL